MEKATVSMKKRQAFAVTFVKVIFLLLAVALFYVQIVKADEYQKKAIKQWTRTTELAAMRGSITDANGVVLAQSASAYKVLVWPEQVEKDEAEYKRISTELSKALDLSYDYVYKRVSNTLYGDKKMKEYVLARQLTSEIADAVSALKLGSGVVIVTDTKRYYPNETLLSQVLGFTSSDGSGQYGLELKYNEYLQGTNGRMVTEQDRNGNQIAYGAQEYVEAIDGCNIVLTVDSNIQAFLEKALTEALEVNSAENAQGIIMNAETGAIVAISTKPDFDPNSPPRGDATLLNAVTKNRIVTDAYEPGSTFKIITLAAALDSGAINENYTCTCDGSKVVNGERIKCWRSSGHGTQNLTECAQNSCNCAFMDMALSLGTDKFYDYIYSFGFGSTTGSGMVGEASGIVTSRKYIKDTDLARIGFGQSIAMTPLQLATAVSAAVNGGNLMQPYIIDRVISGDSEVIISNEPTAVRRVISETTSKTVCDILESVVENGSGRNAQVSGYRIGGKTGTAQKYENGAVAEGKLIASFIGIAPMDNPKYVCLILVDEPKVGTIFGSTVAAPFVADVLEETLEYCGVQKTDAKETVTVPSLFGKTVSEAIAELEALGLYATYQTSGIVQNQVPQPGEAATIGTNVLLYTNDMTTDSLKQETITMIDIVGMTRLEAYDALKKIGLVMQIEGEYTGGKVNTQSVQFGRTVNVGDTIIVTFA